ncbi:uncharacterized protein LOC144867384 [Branchiostoma floridae x Branchiostoma japonicum]
MRRSIYGQDTEHPDIADSLNNLGTAWRNLGDHKMAISYYEQSLQMRRSIYGEDTAHPYIADSLNNLSNTWSNLGDHRKAISYYEQSLQMRRSVYGEDTAHPDIANALNNLGAAWRSLGDHKKAISFYEQSLQMMRSIYGEYTAHPDIADSLNILGSTWSNLGDHKKAISYYEQSLQMMRSIYGEGSSHPDIASLLRNLSVSCSDIGDYKMAISYHDEAGQLDKVLGDDFQQMLGHIFSRLDEIDVRLLLRVWSARTGQQESAGIETPHDLMREMVNSGYITTGNLEMLEKDMMAAGISFPAVVRDIAGILQELHHTKTAKAFVGPSGGEIEISGFAKLCVPSGVLQRDTTITVSTVDIPDILRGDEGFSWISGYPWSLCEEACPRELLDQVLFSPAVDVNLHGAQLSGPIELETWRPPGTEGMECVLLKHFDGHGWADITASTPHQIHPDKLSISLQAFCPLCVLWTEQQLQQIETGVHVGQSMAYVLSLRTLNCRFSAHIKPHEVDVDFHVVCRDKSVEKDYYLPGFTMCGSNKAMFDLFQRNDIEVVVSIKEGQKESQTIELCAQLCREEHGQTVQMLLDRPNGKHLKGEVIITTIQEQEPRVVCRFTFREERQDRIPNTSSNGNRTNDHRPETSPNKVGSGHVPTETSNPGVPEMGAEPDDSNTNLHSGPAGATAPASRKEGGKPVVLMLNDEYGTSKGGISTIHRQTARFLALKGAKVYSTVLQANQKDKDDAAADGVQLIFPRTEDDDETPNLKWLTRQHLTYYPHLPEDVDFIVGHVNITSRAAKRIKEDRLPDAKLAQVTHVIPENTSHYKSTERVQEIAKEHASILDDLKDASVVVSVGPRLHDYYTHQTKQVKQLKRIQFLPKPSDIFSKANMEPPAETDTRVVLSIGRVKGVERLKGYDLSARSMGDVIEELPNTKWRLCGIKKGDFEKTQEIINANKGKFEFVPFTPLEYCTQEELCEEMGRADVVLMPSRAEPFGLVGLEAIAAGVPTVVSSKSGLAEFLKAQYKIDGDLDFTHPIVEISGDDHEDVARLKTRIVQILKNRSTEFKVAQRLKQKLLDSKYWEESNKNFLHVFGL